MKTIFAVTAAFVMANAAAFAQVEPFKIDHFKCYVPSQVSQVPPVTIGLQDQFGAATTVVGPIFRLCNPTKKNHAGVITPIQFPNDHLVLHNTSPQPVVKRQVKIRNQFGEQVLITQGARFLAVPTQKDPHGPPEEINHFSCYAVAQGPTLNVPVGLSDQFFASRHNLIRPVLFCNPVQKTHNGVVTPITNPNDHLTCYNISPVAFAKQVGLHNQFGDFKFLSKYTDMACVPTVKEAWQVVN